MTIDRTRKAWLAIGGAAVFGLGALAGVPAVSGHPTSPPSSNTTMLGSSLSCAESRSLDIAAERNATSRGARVPGPNHYPPSQPGFDPSEPPQPAPMDPTTGKLKGASAEPLEKRPDYSNAAAEDQARKSADERPCGEVVDKIRMSAKDQGGIVCFLEDGRYASTVMVDSIREPNPDEICRHLGYAKGEK